MPSICLNMIVKDENIIILRALKSVVKYIDYWVIADTGSTDNTKEIITTFFAEHNIPGEIIDDPWVNFGQNRDNALKFAKNKADYIILLDADMELVVTDNNFKDLIVHDVNSILQGTGFIYRNARLVNGKLDYKYRGVTHEYLECISTHTEGIFDSISFNDYADGKNRADKFVRDIHLLEEGLKVEPNNERYMFYLAQSYKDYTNTIVSEHSNGAESMKNMYIEFTKILAKKTIELYINRINKGGWVEEIWYSKYQIGKLYENMNDWPNALVYYLDAYNFHPKRIETLYEIGKYYRTIGNNKSSYDILRLALKVPYPKTDALFINKNIYDKELYYELSIVAYYVNDIPNMRMSLEYLLHTNYVNKNNLMKNFIFCANKLDNLTPDMDCTIKKISLMNPSHKEYICNPSIILKADGNHLMNVREVSYYFDIEKNYYQYDNTIDTFNHILNIHNIDDVDFATIPNKVIAIADNAIIPKSYSSYITGYEDLRIVEYMNKIYALGTTRIHTESTLNTAVLLELDSNYNIVKVITLSGYEDYSCQKNWIPFIKDSELLIIYSSDPMVILKPDLSTGICTIVYKSEAKNIFASYRGGSQPIKYKNGWLYVIHDVSISDRRHYYHRFVYMDNNFNIINISALFYIINNTIEFVAGLCLDITGKYVYMSFGVEDKFAYVVKINLSSIDKILNLYEQIDEFKKTISN